MAKRCEACGKGPQFGNNVSHANNRTPRRFDPNLQQVRVQALDITVVKGSGDEIVQWGRDGQLRARLADGERVFDVSASPDGTFIATTSNDGAVRIWDAAKYRRLLVLPGHRFGPRPVTLRVADVLARLPVPHAAVLEPVHRQCTRLVGIARRKLFIDVDAMSGRVAGMQIPIAKEIRMRENRIGLVGVPHVLLDAEIVYPGVEMQRGPHADG